MPMAAGWNIRRRGGKHYISQSFSNATEVAMWSRRLKERGYSVTMKIERDSHGVPTYHVKGVR